MYGCSWFLCCFNLTSFLVSWQLTKVVDWKLLLIPFSMHTLQNYKQAKGKYIVSFIQQVEIRPSWNQFCKGGFFSEGVICFSNLPISKKKIFQKTILNLKFKIPAHNIILLWAGILNFKFRIVFWNIFFVQIWRFE